MGIRITTDKYGIKVWRTDKYGYAQYSISIQKKKENGGYITKYKQVKFRGGVEVENGADIIIRDAFPTIDSWKDKTTGELKTKEVWVIMDFVYKTAAPMPRNEHTEQKAQEIEQAAQDLFSDMPDSFQAAEDDIPF